MPNGPKHIWINLVLLSIINLIVVLADLSISLKTYCIFVTAYLFATYFLSPDLDINSSVYNRWGPFRLVWWPYKELCAHRQMSHGLISGPVLIICMLAIILSPAIWCVLRYYPTFDWMILICPLVAIVIVIEAHIVADKLL